MASILITDQINVKFKKLIFDEVDFMFSAK